MQTQTCNLQEILRELYDVGKSIIPSFYLDDELHKLYSILALYFFKDKRFEEISPNYKLSKGVLIRGNVGVGKTICLRTFEKYLRNTKHQNQFVFYSTDDVIQDYLINGEQRLLIHGNHSFIKQGETYNKYLPITRCYDDLGVENKRVKYYGNERNLMADILLKRYDLFITYGLKTIVSTNYTPDEIESFYGNRIRSRMREMMNDIVFDGNDRRK